MITKQQIAVLVSGGVDSAVALSLLKEQGYDVTAFYLKIWLENDLHFLGDCPWEEDLGYVRTICNNLRVPLKIISLQTEYWREVVGYTIEELRAGRTPSPDILCNQRIKFGCFYRHIDERFTKIATGHYAQVRKVEDCYYLYKAPDQVKDQTYFLTYLSQQQLTRALFPIGHLHKSQVRSLARKYDLPNQNRKDSQGICFLGKIKFAEFVHHHLHDKTGDILEYETGKKLGEHHGYWYVTIGQRHGLQLSGGPWYVVMKDVAHNTIYVSHTRNVTQKARKEFTVVNINWISDKKPHAADKNLQVKIRHGPNSYRCTIEYEQEHSVKVKLATPDQGIAAGQFAVFYRDELCFGGGVIREI